MFTFRDMTAERTHVPASLQRDAVLAWTRSGAPQGYAALAGEMNRLAPLPDDTDWPYHRAADRLVQKMRKAGLLIPVRRTWMLTDKGRSVLDAIQSGETADTSTG
jgi:ribosomal protein S19E (S16A)